MSETETTTIDLEKAKELTRGAIELRGDDFVYNPSGFGDCFYRPRPDKFEENDPRAQSGCLVGTALELIGIELEPTLVANGSGLNEHIGPEFVINHDAGNFFDTLQEHQDGGKTWGDSYRIATGEMRNPDLEDEDDEEVA